MQKDTLNFSSFVSTIYGEIDHERMKLSLKSMMEKHVLLQTCFITDNDVIKQNEVHLDNLPLTFFSKNFQSNGHLKHFISEYAASQRMALLEKNLGPLFNCTIIKYDLETYLFLLTIDQVICATWSIHLFLQELLNHYAEQDQYQTQHNYFSHYTKVTGSELMQLP